MAAFRRIARSFSRSKSQLEKNVESQPQAPEAASPPAEHPPAESSTGIKPALAGLWRNVGYTFRQLRRSPGFALTAVLALALGVGPNVAIFSIIWATFFAKFPYPHAEQLVVVWTHHKGERGPTFSEDYAHYAAESHSFQRLDFESWTILHLTNPDHTQDENSGLPFTPGMNTITMGGKMLLGRDLLPDEGGPGNDHVVMLYHWVWANRYHSDPGIVGKYILIEDEPYRVVGVVAEGPNERAGGIQFCVPIRPTLGSHLQQAGNVIGRLKPGVTIAQAQAEMAVIDRRLAAHRNGGSDPNAWSVSVEQLRNDWLDPKIQRNLWLLLAAVGLVLLIACANVANLLLARGASRKQELAVRSALGATRRQIFVQLLTESVTLALMGGLIGIAMGWGIMKFSKANFPDLVNQSSETVVEMNIPVLCFALGVTLIAGVLFGCAPGWQARRLNISDALRRGSRSARGRVRFSTQSILVTVEIALALTLLEGAGMALHSFWNLTHIDLGFTVDRILTARLQLQFPRSPDGRFAIPPPAQIIAQQRQLLDRLQAVPGVANAGLASSAPLQGFDTFPFSIAGQTVDQNQPPVADFEVVSPSFFSTFAIHLIRGRFLSESDTLATPFAIVVNETFVHRYLPNTDPLTQRLTLRRLHFAPSKLPFKPQFDNYQIVGVYHDVLDSEHLTGAVQPQMYASLWQGGFPFVSFVVHTAVDPIGVTPGIRAAIASASSGIAITQLETMQQVVSAQESTDQIWNVSLRRIRRDRTSACRRRNLRSDGVRRGTAHARDRGAHGARCETPRGGHAHRSRRNAPGTDRYRHRAGRSIRPWPSDALDPLRRSGIRPGKLGGRGLFAVHGGACGLLAPRSPFVSH